MLKSLTMFAMALSLCFLTVGCKPAGSGSEGGGAETPAAAPGAPGEDGGGAATPGDAGGAAGADSGSSTK